MQWTSNYKVKSHKFGEVHVTKLTFCQKETKSHTRACETNPSFSIGKFQRVSYYHLQNEDFLLHIHSTEIATNFFRTEKRGSGSANHSFWILSVSVSGSELCFRRMDVLQSHRAEMLTIAMAVVAIGVGTAYYFYVTKKPKGLSIIFLFFLFFLSTFFIIFIFIAHGFLFQRFKCNFFFSFSIF